MSGGDEKDNNEEKLEEKSDTDMTKISSSDPLYLHLSENPGAILTTTVFNGENYEQWADAMRHSLIAKNKLEFVNGVIEKPTLAVGESTSERLAAWNQCNAIIISWMQNVIDAKLHSSIKYCTIAKELWDDLRARYADGNAPRIHELKTRLSDLRQRNMTVVEYYGALREIWDELAQYNKTHKCTCAVAEEIKRKRK